MYAHKNRRHDRCRITTARLEIRQILRIDFCIQGCYSSIDTSKEPVCPRVELILKIIIILLIIFLGFIKSKPC